MPQFNKEPDSARWFTLVYQSNNELNAQLPEPQAKLHIARLLLDEFDIVDIRSYMHCTIHFAIETNSPVPLFDRINDYLSNNAPPNMPPWFFSLTLVAKTGDAPPRNILFIEGDSMMNRRFRDAITDMGFTLLRPLRA